MADTPLPLERHASVAPHRTWTLHLGPAATDGLIVLGGSVLFALAGVLLGGYLMLPFATG